MNEDKSENDSCSAEPQHRMKWNSRLGYLLSLVGCCVGFGNLWRFPYICNRNGGGAFLLPFLLCLFVIGFPMFFLEAALSQFSGMATPRVWRFCPILKGVGVGTIMSCTAFTPTYNVLLAWTTYYMVKSCSNVLPWTTCGNSWNTDQCVEAMTISTFNSNRTFVGNASSLEGELWETTTLAHTAAEEFWQYGAFLLPFLLCLFVIGFPMFFLEAALSQFSGMATPRVWSFCPILKGVGIGTIMSCTAFTPTYNVLLAWTTYYMVKSCSSVLPWTTCGNSWNTDQCVEAVKISTFNSNRAFVGNESSLEGELWENDTLAHTAAEEFWQYNALGISSGLEEVGSVQWHMVGCLFASSIIICLCMVSGIKSIEKVVYVTAIVPYILLVTIFIRMLMLPGAGAGLLYYLTPDFSRLLHAQVWLEACIQVMFSLTVGWGLIGTASSYSQFHEPCLKDAIIVTAVSEGTSIFAGFVIFATLGVMSEKTGVPISRVVSSGLKQFSNDIEMMLGKPLATPFKILWAFVLPAVLLAVLLLSLLRYEPPSYGKYTYPGYASVIGWFVASAPLIPLPIYAIKAVRKHLVSHTLKESIKLALRPEEVWCPADPLRRKEYRDSLKKTEYSNVCSPKQSSK
ncbi:sodium- and chloride-dependent glycine transporter 2-like [Haliotis rubra]|uniref:sodium- and chloride-dependent glycine transporter 2-like n=1 Tax=Haliotis rubra TaxID=36100 RepID=UPI001EE546D3|nr:sodium- and chloride-dependent glycine transporter 2-like [Haliotis rubra]